LTPNRTCVRSLPGRAALPDKIAHFLPAERLEGRPAPVVDVHCSAVGPEPVPLSSRFDHTLRDPARCPLWKAAAQTWQGCATRHTEKPRTRAAEVPRHHEDAPLATAAGQVLRAAHPRMNTEASGCLVSECQARHQALIQRRACCEVFVVITWSVQDGGPSGRRGCERFSASTHPQGVNAFAVSFRSHEGSGRICATGA